MALSRNDLQALMDAFEASDWSELVVELDGTRVELSKTGRPPESSARPRGTAEPPKAPPRSEPAPDAAPPPAAPAAPARAQPAEEAPHGVHRVTAPSVGIFYRAPEPGAPPFVDVGAHVEPDDIVCIVEVMKLMNHVKAGAAGVVRDVHAENGTMIEFGDVLFTIDLDG